MIHVLRICATSCSCRRWSASHALAFPPFPPLQLRRMRLGWALSSAAGPRWVHSAHGPRSDVRLGALMPVRSDAGYAVGRCAVASQPPRSTAGWVWPTRSGGDAREARLSRPEKTKTPAD
jgi:hypothetical protein